MRNILLLIDDQEESYSLIKMSYNLAKNCMANIVYCYTSKIPAKHLLGGEEYEEGGYPDDDDASYINQAATIFSELADQTDDFQPGIKYIELDKFNVDKIKRVISSNGIWLTILAKPDIVQLRARTKNCYAYQAILKLNSPVLLWPNSTDFKLLNSVAYVTDLRYCDHGVIQFLKVFKTSIYVIHISAPGLVDMNEPFAQDLLMTGINPKVNYQKLFLRNIKGKHIAAEIDLALDPLEVKVFSFSSNKHQTLERLLGEPGDKIHNFHDLPYLVFPYLNWHNDPSFYW